MKLTGPTKFLLLLATGAVTLVSVPYTLTLSLAIVGVRLPLGLSFVAEHIFLIYGGFVLIFYGGCFILALLIQAGMRVVHNVATRSGATVKTRVGPTQ
jgi:hypothetical protein